MSAGCSEPFTGLRNLYSTSLWWSYFFLLLLLFEYSSQEESSSGFEFHKHNLRLVPYRLPENSTYNFERKPQGRIKHRHTLRHRRQHRIYDSSSLGYLSHSDELRDARHATDSLAGSSPVTHFEYPRDILSPERATLDGLNSHARSASESGRKRGDGKPMKFERRWLRSNAPSSSSKKRKRGNYRSGSYSPRTSPSSDLRNGRKTRQMDGERSFAHRRRRPKEIQRESRQERAKEKRPNIILMMTDDLDVELGSLNYMPRLLQMMGGRGAFFPNSYTSTPMCCPSRSSMLTGMYIHNHEIYTNHKNCSGPQWQKTHERRSFATYLKNAGYKTAYFGKYLNRYNGSHVPPGWQEWAGLVANSKYYNYTVNRNSHHVKYGNKYPQDYFPHVITTDGANFLRESQKDGDDSPFLMVLSYPAPHGPEDSAPEHSHKFFNASNHHTASYNYAPNPDKQWMLQYTDRMPDIQLKFTDLLMTKRLQTLQSIDEAIEKIVTEIDKLGLWNSTYMFFTSDHGYHLGQFGLAKGKSMPFEFDIKVPLFVRGPNIKAGSMLGNIALNIDLAPTFLDIGGLPRPPQMDGRSLLPVLKASHLEDEERGVQWRDSFLVESSGRLREEEELEKKEQRTWERERAINEQLIEATAASFNGSADQAAGSGQSIINLYTSKHERFEEVCKRKEFTSPCTTVQKWHCVQNGDRWRIKKCRQRSDVWKKHCICQSPHGFGTYRKLEPREKKKQRKFLKKYLSKNIHSFDPIFIKSFNNVHLPKFYPRHPPSYLARTKSRRKNFGKRHRRSTDPKSSGMEPEKAFATEIPLTLDDILPDSESATSPTQFEAAFSQPSVELNLDDTLSDKNTHAFVKEEELRDLEDQIHEITDELQSLENASSTVDPPYIQNQEDLTKDEANVHHGCQANDGHIDCQEDVYENIQTWMSSKIAIEDHIRRLRQQLALMKNIHRHLQSKKPESGESENLEIFEEYEATQVSENDQNENDFEISADPSEGDLDYTLPVAHLVPSSRENVGLNTNAEAITETPTTVLPSVVGTTDGENLVDEELSMFDSESPKTSKGKHIHGWRNLRKKGQSRSRTPPWDSREAAHPLRLFPVPMSSLLDEFSVSENEATQPLCWCDRRIAKRLQIQKERAIKRENRQKLREQRQNKKRNRRQRKKKVALCNHQTLNCYTHDNDHWRTPPLWTDGTFCFCINAANNTYWCLRTINQTQNFLYCEFITGLITYYDLYIDPYQLRNVAFTLSNERVTELHSKLQKLRVCAGADDCDGFSTSDETPYEAKKGEDMKVFDFEAKESGDNSVLSGERTLSESETGLQKPNYKLFINKRRKIYKFHERERRRKHRKEKKRKKLKKNKMQGLMDFSQYELEAFSSKEQKIRLPRKSRREKAAVRKERKRSRERRKRKKLRKKLE